MRILDEVSRVVPKFPLTSCPPEMARVIYGIIEKIAGPGDPYAAIKRKSNTLALGVYPKLKKKVARSSDRMLMAIELAIAGNIIDYGVKNSINVEDELKKILAAEGAAIGRENRSIFDYKYFLAALNGARIISSGLDAPGTVLSLCSKRFLKIFHTADMVISKGQGNFEALSDSRRPIFFLFMAKCPVTARDVGCRLGDVVLMHNAKRFK